MSDLCPLVAELIVILEQLTFLLLTPSLVLDVGVELVVPSKLSLSLPLSALLSRAPHDIVLSLHYFGDLAPLLGPA